MTPTDTLCIRGCVHPAIVDGEEPTPKLATVGLLCASDARRLEHILDLVPDLMANMRSQVSGTAAYRWSERVQGGQDGSPAPLRVGPLDAVDGLYAKLAGWIYTLADALGQRPPTLPDWRTEQYIQGARSTTPEAVLTVSTGMVQWIRLRLPDITLMPLVADLHDQLAYNSDDAGPGVFGLNAAYGVEAKRARARQCRECGQRSVDVETLASGELVAICSRSDCRWQHVAEETERVTMGEAARRLGVARSTVTRAVSAGRIMADSDGGVLMSEVRAILVTPTRRAEDLADATR
jgi:hypothetical protein